MTADRPTTIHLVPHTHWDREWYRPFQSFRMQLVDLVDRVMEMLEADPAFAFTLDGQLATVDDYLEIRPEQEERLRGHALSGRLAIGPWQILMDEFLVSGETLVRNLERGWARADDFGGPDARRLPAGHVRPRRPDAADPPSRRPGRCGRVARRSRGRRPSRLPLGGAGRLVGPRRVPFRRLRQRGRHVRRARRARRGGRALRGLGPTLVRRRPGAGDVRHRPRRSRPGARGRS